MMTTNPSREFERHEPSPTETSPRWWLAIDGRPDGPRSTVYVTAALAAGQLTQLTPACPEGGSEWRPLATWPTFSSPSPLNRSRSEPPSPPPYFSGSSPANPVNSGALGWERLLTNPGLPPMGNLICIYAILIVPLYWMLGFVTVFLEDNPFIDGSGAYLAYGVNLVIQKLVTLALTVLLVIAGVRFRDLRASGERLLRLTFAVWTAWVALQWLLQIALFIAAVSMGSFDDSPSDFSFGDLVLLFLNTAALACDVVCLVWLWLKRNQLPLQPNR